MTNAATAEASRRLARAIYENRNEIERRWLARVKADLDRNDGIELTGLRAGIPDYLAGLVQFLSGGDASRREPNARQVWVKVAREHGITRVRIGFDIEQLVHEFVVLRQVIQEVAGADELPLSLLADALEDAIAASVQAYVEARDVMARRRQAEHIAFLTHELRNPLGTAILGASQLRKRLPPEHQSLLDKLDRSHRRLAQLIDSVLLTERLEANVVESHPVDTKLGQVMEGALEAARALSGAKGLTMRVSYDPELQVRIDPALTRSAVQNLADNAVKYTDEGEVTVTVDRDDESLTVHVHDTGPGVSKEELVTIFEPFERGSTSKPGTGLGLAIARRAIEAQGGSIGAESPGPSGCHFWITLPRFPRERRAADERGEET